MEIELCRERQLGANSGRGSLSGWSHPQMPLKASTSRLSPGDEEYMLKRLTGKATCELSLKKKVPQRVDENARILEDAFT